MAEEFYIARFGRTEGPWTLQTVLEKVHGQEISGETLAWRPGEADWRPLQEIVQMPAQPGSPPRTTQERPESAEADLPELRDSEEPPPIDHVRMPGTGEKHELPADLDPRNWSRQGPEQMPSTSEERSGISWLGLLSLGWGILASFIWLAVFVVAGIIENQGGAGDAFYGLFFVAFLVLLALNMVAGLFGIIGVIVDPQRIFAFIGVAINGLHTLGIAALMILGILVSG